MNDKVVENNNINQNNVPANYNYNPNNVAAYNASVNNMAQNNNTRNTGQVNNVPPYNINDINNMSATPMNNENFTIVNNQMNGVSQNSGTVIPTQPINNASHGVDNTIKITEATPYVANNQVPNENNKTISTPPVENNDNNSNGGGGRGIILILFFTMLLIFILFLPNISEIINTGNFPFKKIDEVQNGVLMCSMKNESDLTDTTYEMRFTFNNKKLSTSVLEVTIESEDKEVVNNKHIECQSIRDIAVDGVEVSCTVSGSITNAKYNYNYQMIDKNNLTKFTEAGGVYPEHKYKENIYNIKSNMIKNGYNCEIRGN